MAVIVLAVVFISLNHTYKNKTVNKKEPKEPKPESSDKGKLSSRTEDVLKTLKAKEKEVVTFLIDNNHKSTQAKIRYSTGIPKTTLARIFISLELKNIVKIEKVGKLKNVSLTEWFIGEG